MTIDLPPELEAFVKQEIETGDYASREEVVARGLQLLRELKIHELRRKVQVGIDELERGDVIELADEEALKMFFDGLIARSADRLERERSSK